VRIVLKKNQGENFIMPKIDINRDRCKGCYLCIEYCPNSCIVKDTSLNNKGAIPVTFNKNAKCSGCGFCAIICPDVCIEVYR